jgi:hypothetical protein
LSPLKLASYSGSSAPAELDALESASGAHFLRLFDPVLRELDDENEDDDDLIVTASSRRPRPVARPVKPPPAAHPKPSPSEPPVFRPTGIKIPVKKDLPPFPEDSDAFGDYQEAADEETTENALDLRRPREFVIDLIKEPPPVEAQAELRRHDVSKQLAKVRKG